MNVYNKICRKISRKYTWLRSKAYVFDLRLQGASVPWGTVIADRIQLHDAHLFEVSENVCIGKRVKIIANGSRILIGKNSRLGSNVRIDGMGGDIHIGANVLINTFTILTAWSGITIENNVLIAPFCHITDRNHGVCKDKLIREQVGTSKPIYIGQDVWIGSSCVILQGVKIGEGAVVGANSVVTKSIDDYTIVAGAPVRVIGVRK